MRIYITGPLDRVEDLSNPAFHSEAARLRAMGHEVGIPATLAHGMREVIAQCLSEGTAALSDEAKNTLFGCMKADFAALKLCEIVAILPGFDMPHGETIDANLSEHLGLKVCRMNGFTGEVEVAA